MPPSSAPASPGESDRGRFAAGLVAVAAVAMAVRVGFVLTVSRHLPLGGDPETYHLLGDRLASGRGYVRPFGLVGVPGDVPTAEFPPLFPGLLAGLDLAGIDSPTGQKLALAAVGAATAVVVGLLAGRLAGSGAGIAAGMVVALHPAFFENDGGLASESLYVLAVATILLAAYRALESDRLTRWVALGALVGLGALVRAEALGFLLVLVVPGALLHLGGSLRLRWIRIAVAGAAATAVVAPWTIRNAIAVDAFVPVSSNAGTLLAGANCDDVYSGPATGLWSLECVFQIDAPARDEGERNATYFDGGLDYMADHASAVPRVVGIRVLRTWGAFDPAGQIEWETFESRHRRWHWAGYGAHIAVVLLALPGVMLLRSRGTTLLPLLATALLVIAVSAVAYGNQRFRVAADVSLAVLAGTTIGHLARVASRLRT